MFPASYRNFIVYMFILSFSSEFFSNFFKRFSFIILVCHVNRQGIYRELTLLTQNICFICHFNSFAFFQSWAREQREQKIHAYALCPKLNKFCVARKVTHIGTCIYFDPKCSRRSCPLECEPMSAYSTRCIVWACSTIKVKY